MKPQLLTDAQILECRALHQFAGWKRGQLAERYGLSPIAIDRFVSGTTAVRLVATLKDLPEFVEPLPQFRVKAAAARMKDKYEVALDALSRR